MEREFDISDASTYTTLELLTIIEGYEEKRIVWCALSYEEVKSELKKRNELDNLREA